MSAKPLPLKRGNRVHITHKGQRLYGIVSLASSNHRSLMIEFDGMLGGWIGAVPLSWTDAGYECLRGQSFEVEQERVN